LVAAFADTAPTVVIFDILADETSHQNSGHAIRWKKLDQASLETTQTPADCPDGSASILLPANNDAALVA